MTGGFGDLLAGGRPAVGTWVKLPVADSVEMLAAAGFDFVAVDMEHAPLDLPTVHRLLGTAAGCGIPALVRVPDRTASTIGRVLDSGADGVLVPHVDDTDQALAAVAHTRFPPHGTRGYGPTVRAGRWGSDPQGYLDAADCSMAIPQLESPQAVAAVDDIAAVPGLGALFVGPADLAVATGLPVGSAEFDALLARVQAAAVVHAVPLGTAVGTAAAARELPDHYDFVLVGNDASMLAGTARSIVDDLRPAGDLSPAAATAKDRP